MTFVSVLINLLEFKWLLPFTILLILFIEILLSQQNKINTVSIQGLEVSKWQSNVWLKQIAAKANFFRFIFRVRGRILRSVKAEWKNYNLILSCRWFSIWGKNVLILGNLDTVGKICISRPLGTTLATATWLIRQKITVCCYKTCHAVSLINIPGMSLNPMSASVTGTTANVILWRQNDDITCHSKCLQMTWHSMAQWLEEDHHFWKHFLQQSWVFSAWQCFNTIKIDK